jgi:GT2 family glycosyltransferase
VGELSYGLWSLEKEQDVDWVYEAFYAVRSSLFTRLNGFDPRFVMYHEGPDFCLRARQAGFTTKWTPRIQAVHKKIDNTGSRVRTQFMEQSTQLWYQKHLGIAPKEYKKLYKGPATSPSPDPSDQ